MIYRSDFKPSLFRPRFDYEKDLSDLRRGGRKIKKKTLEPEVAFKHEEEANDENSAVLAKLHDFAENTSIHGFKFIGQTQLHWSERLMWLVLVSMAIFGIVHISLKLSEKFSSSPLSTVVESTIYPVSEIAYPSVTICANNRLHADRCREAEAKFLPNATEKLLEIFRLLLRGLNNVEFGAFDEYDAQVLLFTSEDLNRLNLTEVYRFAMLTCEEIFIGKCWWRNKYLPCCDDLFRLQTSEYGLCYSFNSAVNEIGSQKERNLSIPYPFRTSNYGEWSGLRVEFSTRSDLSLTEEQNGIKLIISHPNQWPNSGHFVPSGSTTSITIKPTFSYTTSDVKRLTPEQRQCLNDGEAKSSKTLPGLKYLQLNCLSQCRQKHMTKYCGCSISLFYPIGARRDCNFEDLKCLNRYNDIFNYEKPPVGNPYFDDEAEGMECGCLPECHRVDYSIEITSNILASSDNMTLDLHYQSANLVKYRTDVTFGWLDLMVAFGGIAGLFLGCSLLSGVEIIYYATTILMILLRQLNKTCRENFSMKLQGSRLRDVRGVEEKKSGNGRRTADSVQIIKVISLTDIDKASGERNAQKGKSRY